MIRCDKWEFSTILFFFHIITAMISEIIAVMISEIIGAMISEIIQIIIYQKYQ